MSAAAQIETERHYSVRELAELWNLSENAIRPLFRDRNDVLKLGHTSLLRRKRQHVTLRIPASVAAAVHWELRNR